MDYAKEGDDLINANGKDEAIKIVESRLKPHQRSATSTSNYSLTNDVQYLLDLLDYIKNSN